jgi:hypothetical protein
MAGEAELKIGSGSIEKTTAALDSLIGALEKLVTAQVKQQASTDNAAKSLDASTAAVKQSEIARNKAISLLDLESKGLSKNSDAYSKLKGEILAQEVAAKKNIDTATEDYNQILLNIAAKEKATTANKELIASVTSTTSAMKASEAASIKATSLLSLQEKGLDELSTEYAELKAEILAKDVALRKGIATDSEEYAQILKTTKAQEVATTKMKAMRKEQAASSGETKKSSDTFKGFTDILDNTGKQAQLVDGPLGGIASRMTALSGILKGPAVGLAAISVAIAGLFLGLKKGVGIASETEVAFKQLEAQVRVTGGAAGYSAEQFDMMARSFAMSTLGSTQEMRGLISSLLVFDQVAGDAFSRTIALSNDFAATGLASSGEVVKKLGRVLQDPVAKFTELKELGVDFNFEQLKSVESAIALGDAYAAQDIILSALEAKVKGVAAAQADSLAGDLDTFGQQWNELWEKAGALAIPVIRGITQAASSGLELILRATESDAETALRHYRAEQKLTTLSSKELKIELEGITDQLENNRKKIAEISAAPAPLKKVIGQWGASDVADEDAKNKSIELIKRENEMLELQASAIKDVSDANAQRAVTAGRVTLEQEIYLDAIEKELVGQQKLNSIFIATRDTRSEAYRRAKVEEETLAQAREKGLEGNLEEIAQIRAVVQAKSDLTEQNILLNTSIQREQALLNQQDAIKKEIELNRLVGEGLQRNSLEYERTAALIDLRNKVLASGGSVQDDEFKRLEKETVALVGLQAEMRKVTALRQFDAESSTTQALEKSIELNTLLTKGVSETSDEYIRYNMELNARNVALQQGISLESEDYQQILNKAQAVADLQIKLQDLKDVQSLGLSFSLEGGLISSDSLAGIQDETNRSVQTIMDVALSQGLEVDDPLIESLLASVNQKFQDSKDQLYLPLGLVVDEEGALLAIESVEAVKLELSEKLREMDAAARELGIEDEIAYQERRAEVVREFEDKTNEARVESFRKSAENMELIRAKDTADSISAGLANLSAAAGNNKRLAQLSKAAAIFSASVSLVQGISEANKLPFPANIPAYAKALVTGTQIVQMASSLKDPSFAFGGIDIQGAGTGRSDSIKANIARGESVITAPATSQYKETLKRMNAGLPIGSGSSQSVTVPLSINIQGDASENTVRLIDESLRNFETRVQQISEGVSMETIQHEQNYGGLLGDY